MNKIELPVIIIKNAREYYHDIYRGEDRDNTLRIIGFQDGVRWLWDFLHEKGFELKPIPPDFTPEDKSK